MAAGIAAAFAVSATGGTGAAAQLAGTVTVADFEFQGDDGTSTATIATGGTVTFSYPTGASFHNVDFLGAEPTSCTQTAGPVQGAVPPLPTVPTPDSWAGTCQFNTPGTYAFVCQAHNFMTGDVVVEPPTATTTPTATAPTTTTPTTPTTTTGTTTSPPPPTGTTPGGTTTPTTGDAEPPPPRPRVTVARRQEGTILRGSVMTSAVGSRIVVTALVSNRALKKNRPRRVRKVQVGSQSKRATRAGKTSFAVKLNASARRALARRERLRVGLRIVVTPPGGRAVTTVVTVMMLRSS